MAIRAVVYANAVEWTRTFHDALIASMLWCDWEWEG